MIGGKVRPSQYKSWGAGDLIHDGRWNMFDENVLKPSKVSFWGVKRTLQSNINIYYPPPPLQVPTYNGRPAAYPAAGVHF
jgi:hypothetical protein